jgi:FemAB family protein
MTILRKDDHAQAEVRKLVEDILNGNSVSAQVLTDQEYDDSIFDAVEYVPFHYMKSWKAFDEAHLANHGNFTLNFLIVFVGNGETKSFWRLDLSEIDGHLRLGTEATQVLAPIYSKSCHLKFKKKINKTCIAIAQTISEKYVLGDWCSADYGPKAPGITSWHLLLRNRDADCEIKYDMYVNLGMEVSEIKATFRSSYKSLVNQGEKLWKCSILNFADEGQWNEFHTLHTKVSGRETRSKETWEIQFGMIRSGAAFAILLRDDSDSLVGGGFFAHSRDEGIYFSGAYDRDLFPLPLGHVVQARAISEFKKRGVGWYFIGTMVHENRHRQDNEKELSISNFKEGFATHILPRYILMCPNK